MYEYLGFICITPFIGGVTSYLFQNNSNIANIFNSFSGGIILGACLMHTMPDSLDVPSPNYPLPFLLMGCVILFLYLIQIIVPIVATNIKIGDNNQLSNISSNNNLINLNSLFFSLITHGIFEGFSAGSLTYSINSWITIIGLVIHKSIEYSILGTYIRKHDIDNKLYYWGIIITANIPCVICFCISSHYANNINIDGYFASLTSGTFLYLSLSHIIPESLSNKPCFCIKEDEEEDEEIDCCATNDNRCCEIELQHNEFSNCYENLDTNTNTNINTIPNNMLSTIVNKSSKISSNKMITLFNGYNITLSVYKIICFISIGLGFTVFCLLALIPE